MVVGFIKSEEGLKEYRKIGLPYLDNLDDKFYNSFLRTTSADNLSQYTSHKEKELASIAVHQVADSTRFGSTAEDDDDNAKKGKKEEGN